MDRVFNLKGVARSDEALTELTPDSTAPLRSVERFSVLIYLTLN